MVTCSCFPAKDPGLAFCRRAAQPDLLFAVQFRQRWPVFLPVLATLAACRSGADETGFFR